MPTVAGAQSNLRPGPSPTARASRSLSVVIPAFDEEHRIGRSLETIHAYLLRQGYEAEILVVDDGSRDRTRDVVLDLARSLTLVRLLGYAGNRGKGFAVRTGVLAASREAVLFSDADLSTPISELDRLWPHYDAGRDVVIASRSVSRSRIVEHQPFYRENMGRMFNALVSMFVVRGFRDTQCGFKLFRRETAARLFSQLLTDGFAFDVEILLRARKLGLKVAEVGVEWHNSAPSKVRAVQDSARMLLELLRVRSRV